MDGYPGERRHVGLKVDGPRRRSKVLAASLSLILVASCGSREKPVNINELTDAGPASMQAACSTRGKYAPHQQRDGNPSVVCIVLRNSRGNFRVVRLP